MKYSIIIILLILTIIGCSQQSATVNTNNKEVSLEEGKEEVKEEVVKLNKPYSEYTNADWGKVLTSEQYNVLREKGTERPFTGKLLSNKKEGTYVCSGCKTPLYKSSTKFKSGTGWPSFYDAIKGNVGEITDKSYGMERVEIVCNTCQGHLGHVFTDGPQPTGLRHCVNSLSLEFKEEK